MIVKLFDIQNHKVIPTEHCYTLSTLKNIMDKYPEQYLKIYEYLFYMTCPNPDLNPFFYIIEGYRYAFLEKAWMFQNIEMTIYFWCITIFFHFFFVVWVY